MKKIMVVDDEEDTRNTVKLVMENQGYGVVTAENADDCLKKAMKKGSRKPDLILMDIMMPGTPVREILPKLKGIKIIFLSVVATTEDEKEQLQKQKNVVKFIHKPFDIDYLASEVKKAL
jgi:CheY-like chemotaxis protein